MPFATLSRCSATVSPAANIVGGSWRGPDPVGTFLQRAPAYDLAAVCLARTADWAPALAAGLEGQGYRLAHSDKGYEIWVRDSAGAG